MESACHVSGERLSRFLDGELPVVEFRQVGDHVRACASCAGRLRDYARAGELLVGASMSRIETPRPAVWLSVAAALVASLATNLFLPAAPVERRSPVFTRSASTSEGLSVFYAEVASTAPGREVRE